MKSTNGIISKHEQPNICIEGILDRVMTLVLNDTQIEVVEGAEFLPLYS